MMQANLSEREGKIIELLAADNGIRVSRLSEKLGVSQVTVRKNLDDLESKGIVVRSHGRAMPAFYPAVTKRLNMKTKEKSQIAREAASLIKSGDTVMINSTTTGVLIAKYLLGKRDIKIISNSTLILPYARTNPLLRLTLVGEEFRPATEALVGPLAIQMLNNYYAKFAFIGCAGISVADGVTAHEADEAAVVKKITQRAEKVVLVTDSSKFGNVDFVRFLDIDEIDTIITDSGVDKKLKAEIEEAGVTVVVA